MTTRIRFSSDLNLEDLPGELISKGKAAAVAYNGCKEEPIDMSDDRLAPFKELFKNPKTEDYERILELLLEEHFAERGCLWLEEKQSLIYRGNEELRKEFPFSRQAVNEVLGQGRGFLSFNTELDHRVRPSGSIAMNKVRSCLCAASRDAKGEVILLAYFDNSMSVGNFSPEDLDFLQQVLDLAPGAVTTEK